MYHYIRDVNSSFDPLGYQLSVAPELFEQQLDWLHRQRYTTLRMDEAVGCFQNKRTCPRRSIVLTFDDGYADAFDTVLPALQRYGFRATFYIPTGLIGLPGYMNWKQLMALRDAGMEIGAHTIDHIDLTLAEQSEALRQIRQSKADLKRQLDIDVVSFCYPAGRYNEIIMTLVEEAGFWSATTTRWDNDTSSPMALPRRRVTGDTTIQSFQSLVQE